MRKSNDYYVAEYAKKSKRYFKWTFMYPVNYVLTQYYWIDDNLSDSFFISFILQLTGTYSHNYIFFEKIICSYSVLVSILEVYKYLCWKKRYWEFYLALLTITLFILHIVHLNRLETFFFSIVPARKCISYCSYFFQFLSSPISFGTKSVPCKFYFILFFAMSSDRYFWLQNYFIFKISPKWDGHWKKVITAKFQ